MHSVGFDDKVYPPAKIAAIVDLLGEEGISGADALRGTGISLEALQNPATKVSLVQVIESYRNGIRLSRNPRLAFALGAKTHLSAYGLYGFAMLCSPDLRKTMDFAVKYQALAAPLCGISFEERDRQAIWRLDPAMHPKIDGSLYRFITELQISIHISLLRDISPSFTPLDVDLTYPQTLSGLTGDVVGCRVQYGQPENRIVFDAAWLDVTPDQGHRMTYPEMVSLCDNYLKDLSLRAGPAGQVRQILIQRFPNGHTFTEIATALRTTTRTLRRQLHHQGTSFRQLVDELRVHLAVKYLRGTVMTTEDIAYALGFADAASFRRGFHRWTGKSPNAFRRQDCACDGSYLTESRETGGNDRRGSAAGVASTR